MSDFYFVASISNRHCPLSKLTSLSQRRHHIITDEINSKLVSASNSFILTNNLYSSPDIFRMIKSKRIRLAGHVACMGEMRGVYSV
jgi:hypothetical protein